MDQLLKLLLTLNKKLTNKSSLFGRAFFYKKGTSLVELIAVIVIMGIIAGIAIPTTIAVIDRQKQNASIKSAETVYTAAKQVLLEASADPNSTVIATAAADGVIATSTGYSVTNVGLKALGEIEKDPCKSGQTITVAYATASNSFTVTATAVEMTNGKKVDWDADKQIFKKAASGSSSSTTPAAGDGE